MKIRETPPGFKWCPDCGEFRPLDDFYRAKYQPFGRQGYCKPHMDARSKASQKRT